MSELQWALLILGAVAVVAIYFYSRRDARALKGWQPPSVSESPLKPKPPTKEQMEMFQSSGNFDEYGVSKPRIANGVRREPQLDAALASATAPAPAAAPAAAPVAPKLEKSRPVGAPPEERFVTLLIAEREGTAIFGPKLHEALRAQKLKFGERQVYHRLEQGMVQFSVASLIKPGTLDPAEAKSFSTPGLSVFLLLPGPVKPLAAFDDMLATARALAQSLNAEVFDAHRQPLTEDAAKYLRGEVDSWARTNHLN